MFAPQSPRYLSTMTILVIVRIYFVMEWRDSGPQQASSGIGLRNSDRARRHPWPLVSPYSLVGLQL